jgi:hypothetical protein
LYDIDALFQGRKGNAMKITIKTLWAKFVVYLNTVPPGSRERTALGSYAGLCGLGHDEDIHH